MYSWVPAKITNTCNIPSVVPVWRSTLICTLIPLFMMFFSSSIQNAPKPHPLFTCTQFLACTLDSVFELGPCFLSLWRNCHLKLIMQQNQEMTEESWPHWLHTLLCLYIAHCLFLFPYLVTWLVDFKGLRVCMICVLHSPISFNHQLAVLYWNCLQEHLLNASLYIKLSIFVLTFTRLHFAFSQTIGFFCFISAVLPILQRLRQWVQTMCGPSGPGNPGDIQAVHDQSPAHSGQVPLLVQLERLQPCGPRSLAVHSWHHGGTGFHEASVGPWGNLLLLPPIRAAHGMFSTIECLS